MARRRRQRRRRRRRMRRRRRRRRTRYLLPYHPTQPHPTPPNASLQLPTTYYLLPTTYYLPPTTYYLLPTTYYLLPITFKRGKKPHTRGAIAVEGVTAGTRSDWDQVGTGYPASLQCIPSHPIPSHPIPFHSILSHPTGVCTPQAGGQAEVD